MSNGKNEIEALKYEVRTVITIQALLLALLWGIWLSNALLFHGALNAYGIRPRTAIGLLGILFAPFLHLNLPHILGNSTGIIFLGSLVLARDIGKFALVSAAAVLVGGLGVWLIGAPNSVHIGISGVIFGYFGYLLTVGIFEKKLGTILLSVFTFLMYGGMIWGILPVQLGVSWEGHLFGLASGILSALILSRHLPEKRNH